MSFTGKVAIVTGAAAGIGAATANALAREGAKVALVDKDEAKLKEGAKQCEKYGDNLIIKADISKDEEVRTVVKKTIERFGKIDVLVNNAGVIRMSYLLDESFIESFDLTMNMNLRSMAYLTHMAAPYLIKTKGNIVNIASTAAYCATEGFSSYATSKAGVHHFTRCIALELAQHGIRVNTVAPGLTNTKILHTGGIPNADEWFEVSKAQFPLKKVGDPEEIADLILFLASDKAKSVSGSSYVCDNGKLLK